MQTKSSKKTNTRILVQTRINWTLSWVLILKTLEVLDFKQINKRVLMCQVCHISVISSAHQSPQTSLFIPWVWRSPGWGCCSSWSPGCWSQRCPPSPGCPRLTSSCWRSSRPRPPDSEGRGEGDESGGRGWGACPLGRTRPLGQPAWCRDQEILKTQGVIQFGLVAWCWMLTWLGLDYVTSWLVRGHKREVSEETKYLCPCIIKFLQSMISLHHHQHQSL